jgi:4-carboxymuconolactone decarboxylase
MKAIDRLPPLPEEEWSPEQRKHALEIISGPRGALVSPFIPLLRSPELMGLSQRLGEYLRYRSFIGLRLTELAILVIARHWSQDAEWAIHAPIAVSQGIAISAVEAIRTDTAPACLMGDEQLVYVFCRELLETQTVSDETWNEAVVAFDESGCVDLIGVVGYYSYLALLMNAAQTPAPQSTISALLPRQPLKMRPPVLRAAG